MDLCRSSSAPASALHVVYTAVVRRVVVKGVAKEPVTIETKIMTLTTVKVLSLTEEIIHKVDSPC